MHTLPAAHDPAMKPTHARYNVVLFAMALAVITYIHRVCISQAESSIRTELEFDKVQMGYVFSAFSWSYALFQIPGGWAADRFGARRVLTLIVIWWSLSTIASGWVTGLYTLIAARFLFGAGQGGGFPVLTKSFTTWLPTHERVRAQSWMWLSARWGGAFTPLLVFGVMQLVSWRRAFEILGALGLVWVFFYWRWYRDDPRTHAGVNEAELQGLPVEPQRMEHDRIPWMRFLLAPTVWLLCVQYFCLAFGWYFYITWLPTYLKEGRSLSAFQSAALAAFPLFFGGLGSLFCGTVIARVERFLGSVSRGRQFLAAVGCIAAGSLLILSVQISNPVLAMVAMGFASFANDLAMPPSWGACMDVGGRYAGTVSGMMNMAGNMAGWVAPPLVGYVLKWNDNNWTPVFFMFAGVYYLGTLCWIFIDPVSRLDE